VNGRTDAQTYARRDNPKTFCLQQLWWLRHNNVNMHCIRVVQWSWRWKHRFEVTFGHKSITLFNHCFILYCVLIICTCIVLYFDVIWFYDHKTEIKAYLLTYLQLLCFKSHKMTFMQVSVGKRRLCKC